MINLINFGSEHNFWEISFIAIANPKLGLAGRRPEFSFISKFPGLPAGQPATTHSLHNQAGHVDSNTLEKRNFGFDLNLTQLAQK